MKDFKKDYYKILELHPSAGIDEIKLAYRKQVKKYHPDINPGNSEDENLIKDIIEAYEVLGNKDERFVYDQYLFDKKVKQKHEPTSRVHVNKRTYTKTSTRSKEERIYLKGKIFIKYCGKHDERDAENILRESFYRLKITQTNAIIEQTYKEQPSEELLKIFADNKPLNLRIQQPVSCQILNTNKVIENYKLELINLTVPNPEIINVTKHEDESFGTLTGTFYCYVREIKTFEEEITVEECFGETGESEHKVENGINYFRKRYYNADCSKYWGNWVAEIARSNTEYSGRTQTSGNYTRYEHIHNTSKPTQWSNWKYTPRTIPENNGCLGSLGNIIGIGFGILFILFLFPRLAFLLPFILIPYLLNLLPIKFWNWIFKITFILFGVLFCLALISSILRDKNKRTEHVVNKPKTVIKKPRYTPVVNPRSSDHSNQIVDTIISNHMVWEDYNGKTYEGIFSIKKSALNQAHSYKQNLDIAGDSENNYDKIIFSLKENDKNKLSGLYSMFDSIRKANKSNPMEFAEIIVSFVQTIPYTIILPNDCDARYYQDEFTAKYLSSPNARCDGFEKYGINTPVEFVANLNGDCDTRTLFLYTVLSHYDYNVALLSSSHYSHSILGINLPYDGTAFEYNNQRYVFWETTVKNIKPGVLSDEISNTDYWRISLKSK